MRSSFSGCVTVNKLMSISGIHQINAIMAAGKAVVGNASKSPGNLSLGATCSLYKEC